MADAIIGYLAEYAIHDGEDPGVFTDVGEVIDINTGEESADRVETTHMQSPNRTREYTTGLIDPGEGSVMLNWIPGNATDLFLRGLRNSGEQRLHRVTYPNGVTETFTGAILSMSKVIPIDDRMTATVTIARSGETTWGAEAAPTNTVLPAISGIAQVGGTLTAFDGVWTGGPSFTYVWEADGTPISGATSKTYVPVVGDIGDTLTVVVTGTNSEGSDDAESAATAAVIAAD